MGKPAGVRWGATPVFGGVEPGILRPPQHRRRWRWLASLLAATGVGLGFTTPAIARIPPDHLGVWFTTVDSAVLTDPAEAERALRFLSSNGIGRVAVPLLTGGSTTWPVEPWRNPMAVPLDPRIAGGSVAPLLTQLRSRGLRTIGWFEFGLMAPAGVTWLQGREHLLLARRDGGTTWTESPGLERVWLNPALAEVQDLLTALVVDACRRLPLDAIQFDDHLGYPSDFGYDAATLRRWRATDAGAADPTPDPQAPAWLAWRSRSVTDLLERIRTAMARECPGVKLSVAPNPQAFSYRSYLADWSDWVARDLVDEVVVQIYRWDRRGVAAELADPSLEAARARVPLRIGLLAGLRNQPKDPASLQQELDLAHSFGFTGIDLFFYETARPHFPATP
ncbi:family 10 glycosylhydrolase [Synechococcus sp. GFB01]|uniref:family 10 glycosylhydrolase n=1 Tax=Synechococcus sp. GFB01 TaxID=1662190 RepID=UPI0009EA3C25|nr:family 10 glycosylhydrolase [Synechococcus sp. GFB01]